MSVVFADLAGFTAFSEGRDPAEVSTMLNVYFERAIPPVVNDHGGEVERLMGDALMATFNARGDQPDHATRAAAAALAIRDATLEVGAENPEWPRFRVGVNTGEALVGVLGAAGGRSYTVIGDAVNSAAARVGGAGWRGGDRRHDAAADFRRDHSTPRSARGEGTAPAARRLRAEALAAG